MENPNTKEVSKHRGRQWRMRNNLEKWKTLCTQEAERKRKQRQKEMLSPDSEKIKERKERHRIRNRIYRQRKKNEELQKTTNYNTSIKKPTSNRCRLCRNSCQDSIHLLDANGRFTEFMEVEENIPNTLAVLCMECWHHISNFNNFQQMILLVQEKFLQDVEGAKSAEPAEESINDIKYVPPKKESHSQLEEEFDYINDSVVGRGVYRPVRQPAESLEDPGTNTDIKIELSSLSPSAAISTCQLIPTDADMIPEEANMEDIKYVPPKVQHGKLSDITEGTETKFDEVLVYSKSSVHDLKQSKNILIKQEEPLEIVDIYVADEMEDDNDDALHNDDDDDDESLSHPGAINAPINSDNSSDQPEEHSSGTRNKKRRKKTANELDAVIAQWMPTLNCDVCPESFPTCTRLYNHVRKMHNKTKLSVPCCGRVFKSRPCLEEHAQLHLNPQAFECVICKKACLSIHCLKSHMVHVHSRGLDREAVHKCNICGKSFRVPSALRRHVATHAKERSHNCFFCEKSFTYRKGLYYHIKSAHPGKQMPKRTTERPFTKCVHCSKEFILRKCLSRHMRTQHPDMI